MGKALVAIAAVSGLVMALILFAVIGSEEPPPCGQPPAGGGGQVDVRALTYPAPSGGTQPADVYIPAGGGAGSTPRPMIIAIHGGGWFFGDRHELDGVAKDAAAHGYLVVNIEYSMNGPRWPRELDDVRAAIGWARA